MLPLSVHCVVIGDSFPPIVDHCLSSNKKLCDFNKVQFIVHKLQRDYKYSSPGIQAERFKTFILAEECNVMVVDWDLELLNFPDIGESNFPYCGVWSHTGKFDSFIIWSNSFESKKFFELMNEKMRLVSGGIVGAPFYYLNKDWIPFLVREYPNNFYNHHHTRCGGLEIKHTWGQLSDKEKSKW